MDWLVDRHHADSMDHALAGIDDHLRRHAVFDTGVDGAMGTVRAMVADHLPSTGSGLLRLQLDWRGERPRILLGSLEGRAAVDEAGLVPGKAIPAGRRDVLDRIELRHIAESTLELERHVQETFAEGPPPMAKVDADPLRDGAMSVALALSAATVAHPTANPAQAASLAGTVLADNVIGDEPPQTGPEVATAFVKAHRALGSDAQVLAADDRTVEVAITQCPFSPGIKDDNALCHVSAGLAGRLGAHVNGVATVVLAESVATGDEQCHLQMWLDIPDQEVRGERHRWPPVVSAETGPAPQLVLSVNLPSETGSVPVVRRLAAQALRAFGVTDEDVHDVQLAITEACANVIDHASDSDTYEVQVELAADQCTITVVDQGGGFDATAVPSTAEPDAETGRGLALMRTLTDNVAFRNEPQAGTVVHMTKSLTHDDTHPLWSRPPHVGA